MPKTTTATPTGGRRMDLRVIGFAAARREQRLAEAEAELGTIVDELIAAGDFANVELAARLAGVSKGTLYRRLAARQAAA
jgi:hypothetical protein